MKSFVFRTSFKSHPGRSRDTNEDVCTGSAENRFFLVADGVGGANAGEIASAIFMDTACGCLRQKVQSLGQYSNTDLVDCFKKAHSRILDDITRKPDHSGMACTAELLVFQKDTALIGHVGDSRSYLYRGGRLKRLTRDHTFVEQELAAGNMTPEEAKNHKLRHVIYKAVGASDDWEPDIITCDIQDRDIFLLCTDGLTDMVDDTDIATVLKQNSPLEVKVDQLVESANIMGGKDNIAVLLVEVAASESV